MSIIDGRTFMEHLGVRECWDLLQRTPAGRIGVLVDSAPEIYPVNFAVLDRTIVFRTDGGNKLAGLRKSPAVSFEIDHFDSRERVGWSVLVKGFADTLPSHRRRAAAALELDLWTVGDKGTWIQITPYEVSGRRIGRAAARTRPTAG